MQRRDLDTLTDMLQAARTIREYLAGVTRQAFDNDGMRQDAVIRQFEIIGEAARRASAETRADIPSIPWRTIVGMRNILIHAYDHVDIDQLWLIATKDIPDLVAQLEPHVPPEEEVE